MRDGAEYFTAPAGAARRRYEALRAYFTEGMPAAEAADRFGYSTASIHQMATLLRKGRLNLFAEPGPAPKARARPPASCGPALELRAAAFGHRDRRRAHPRGDAGLGADRLAGPRRRGAAAAAPPRPGPPRPDTGSTRSRPPPGPAGHHSRCRCPVIMPGCCSCCPPSPRPACRTWSAGGLPRHQGPDLVAVDRHAAAGQMRPQAPRPRRHAGQRRRAGVHPGADCPAQDHPPGHLLLAGPPRLQPSAPVRAGPGAAAAGLATGEAGFNCDFHAIRHHGDQAVLEKHYVPRRSQRTRAVLTFFAQDHASADMVYSNADITKPGRQPRSSPSPTDLEQATGADPACCFDSQLTTYKILDAVRPRHPLATWRQRGKTELARLDALPASAWKTAVIARSGLLPAAPPARKRHDQAQRRQRQGPPDRHHQHRPRRTHPADHRTTSPRPARNLFARYAERMMIENELDAYISGFHRRAHQRRPAERGPRRHADRRGREPVPVCWRSSCPSL